MSMARCVSIVFGLFLIAPITTVAEESGETVFLAQKCQLCHAVPAADIEAKTKSAKLLGPDLGVEPLAPVEELGPYLRQETELDGVKHKKKFNGTDEELAAMAAWLDSLVTEGS
ncbi:MAG: cytochrome c [Acidobacteriota bacterium]